MLQHAHHLQLCHQLSIMNLPASRPTVYGLLFAPFRRSTVLINTTTLHGLGVQYDRLAFLRISVSIFTGAKSIRSRRTRPDGLGCVCQSHHNVFTSALFVSLSPTGNTPGPRSIGRCKVENCAHRPPTAFGTTDLRPFRTTLGLTSCNCVNFTTLPFFLSS